MDTYIKIRKCTLGELLDALNGLDPSIQVEVPIYPPGDDFTDNVAIDIYDDHLTIDGF